MSDHNSESDLHNNDTYMALLVVNIIVLDYNWFYRTCNSNSNSNIVKICENSPDPLSAKNFGIYGANYISRDL